LARHRLHVDDFKKAEPPGEKDTDDQDT